MDADERIKKILDGDVLTAARMIRDIENNEPGIEDVLEGLLPFCGGAHIVGITGAAGSGKSTLLGSLIKYFRKTRNMTVGVVAIDPSSPVTGGAFLGDRLRMQGEQVDDGLFIRSLASRGRIGGLSDAAENVTLVMDAMGKDVVFIEAVGSGQADVDIAEISDTCIGILVPGMGDDIQMMKAGTMEIADIFVVNKADHEGAESLKAMVQGVISLRGHEADDWVPPVMLTEARTDKGTAELSEQIMKHREYLIEHGMIEKK